MGAPDTAIRFAGTIFGIDKRCGTIRTSHRGRPRSLVSRNPSRGVGTAISRGPGVANICSAGSVIYSLITIRSSTRAIPHVARMVERSKR
jgi:hypothetical protein